MNEVENKIRCPHRLECPMNSKDAIIVNVFSPGLEKWRRGEITFEEYWEELKKFVEKDTQLKLLKNKP